MTLTLTVEAPQELLDASAAARAPRQWKRYRAVVLLSDGIAPVVVARMLGCSRRSVYGWVDDETGVREFPPLRAGWSRAGTLRAVVISGRNAQRVICGALNVQTGELVQVVRPRSRTDDVLAAVTAPGALRPEVRKVLIWDNAPPHHPGRVGEAARLGNIELAFVPFRAPELMPLEDLWRGAKTVVAANRAYATVDDAAERMVAWLDNQTEVERLRRAGLTSSKFDCLPA